MAKVTVPVVPTIGDSTSRSTITFEMTEIHIIGATPTPHEKNASYMMSAEKPDGATFLRLLADALDEEKANVERSH